jgi:hypothetical protein
MAMPALQLVKSCGGWQLLDAGRPALWLPRRDKLLEIATIMADVRSLCHGRPTAVEAQNDDGELEVVRRLPG